MHDKYPWVKVGDWVLATAVVADEGRVCATPGTLGHVIDKRPGYLPTILWEKTKSVYDCIPGEDFEVVATADFAKRPETTPASVGGRHPKVDVLLSKLKRGER